MGVGGQASPSREPSCATSVSVCFPAYNEEAAIRDVVEEAHLLLSRSDLDYEIIVCDDGAEDRTGDILDELSQDIPRMRVLHHEFNQGIWATFEHLYSEATKEFVFLNSTDKQWETSILFDLLQLTTDWDVIIASRKTKHYGMLRGIVSWGFNLIPRLLFGVRTYDAGAVKLVRREIIARFPIASRSPFSEAERLIRAARAGYRITEHPVETIRRKTGKARGASWRQVRTALADVLRVRWALWRGR